MIVSKKYRVWLFGFVLLLLLVLAGFYAIQIYKGKERLNNFRLELRLGLHDICQTELPWRTYLEERYSAREGEYFYCRNCKTKYDKESISELNSEVAE